MDIKFLLSTNLNLISNEAVNTNSNLFFKISTKIIDLECKIVPTCYNLNISWIFFLANFNDKSAEPIIKFSLVDDIQNLRIYLGNRLTVSNNLDQIFASLFSFKPDTDCSRCVCSCILRYSGYLPLLNFFIVNKRNHSTACCSFPWICPSFLDFFLR